MVRSDRKARRAHVNGDGGGTSYVRLAADRLRESGLTVEQAKGLGFEPVANANALHSSFDARPALKIPYWRADDPSRPLTGWPKFPPFYRLRYLGDPPPGFQRVAKPRRYVQAPETPACAYFPRVEGCDWPTLSTDPRAPLMITEGELKAAKACVEGFPCLALGGVWSFQSSDWGVEVLPELRALSWVGRPVTLVYDSDAKDNPQVAHAAAVLADRLKDFGARPSYAFLPDLLDGGAKTGLDDFLVRAGPRELEVLLDAAVPVSLAEPLHAMNRRYVYAVDPGLVLDAVTGQRSSPTALGEATANVVLTERVPVKDGWKLQRADAAKSWMAWPLRRQVERLTYAPGEGVQVATPAGGLAWNVWPGWGVQPAPGDIAPFVELVDHLFAGAEVEAKTWFLRWLAYPLRHPGAKLYAAVALWGVETGTGKSLVGEIMEVIYGLNYKLIRQSDLHGSFNGWAESRQFVQGEEISSTDRRVDADLLKNMISQRTLDVNVKYVPAYTIPDRINYLFTSNHPDAFFLSDQDRRFFVHEVTVKPREDAFYDRVRAWKDGAGPAALFDYLLRLDLGDFSPTSRAFRTAARERMIADTRSDLGDWVARLREDPDGALRVGAVVSPRALWTARELRLLYDPEGKTRTTANGLGRELRKAGFRQVNDGRPVRAASGLDRYYAVRDAVRWLGANPAALSAHLDGRPEPARGKFRRKER